MSTSNFQPAADDGSHAWDAIVIGGGMGGGASAYELARLGLRVLLIEKGLAEFPGSTPEQVALEIEDPAQRLGAARWPTRVGAKFDGRDSEIWPMLGCGLGGSTSLYGAALGRLEPADFSDSRRPDGEPIRWPFDYAALEPYYLRAEALMRVCGARDPLNTTAAYELRPPPAMHDSDRYFFSAMTEAGLHPYRIHVGIEYQPACAECGGYPCPQRCKSDARNRLIEPAVRDYGLQVRTQCEALRLEAQADRVSGVWVRTGEAAEPELLRAQVVVVAAGALFTPVLLQRSVGPDWPQGLGNTHDLVGRNLMFHASDFIAIWPRGKHDRSGPSRTIALRDFYSVEGRKLGEIQSTGIAAGYWAILAFLQAKLQRSALRAVPLLRHFLRIPAWVASKLFADATVFASIVEDYPYARNRVIADESAPSGMRFEYEMPDELRERVKELRTRLRTSLSALTVWPLNTDAELNLGHPCGTCRAGTDPSTSVLDAQCRVHGVENLYVTDSSFMPTSGGTNPSLTVAANALRVAEIIARRKASL